MTVIAYAKWIGAATALVLYSWFWYHLGGQGTRLAVAKEELAQSAAEQKKVVHDETTITAEAKTYEAAAIEPIPATVARVCYYRTAASLPSPEPAGPGADASPAVRSPDPVPTVLGPDIGPSLVRAGHLTDAQVKGLQDYVLHVCLSEH